MVRLLLISVIVVIIPVVMYAQNCTVYGTVKWYDNGDGVPQAKVKWWKSDYTDSTFTNNYGNYSKSGQPTGYYALKASKLRDGELWRDYKETTFSPGYNRVDFLLAPPEMDPENIKQ
ncbi:MAG: carboxypeptidase-like regulatory domain-containing protein [candidate division WOR-3 bacterium]